MTDKFSDSDATRVIAALDARSERKYRNNAQVQTTWGTIGSVDAYNKSASAYLYGETDGAYMSEGFRVPDTMYLSVGDKVKVAINYATGDRWVEEVQVPATAYKKIAIDVKNGQILSGDGTAAPTLFSGTPTGAVIPFAGSSAPTGWLLADGSAVSRTTYAALFATIGTTFGTGDGSTTFNLPNLKSRFPVGRDAANARWDVLGEVGGAETHTHAGHSAHVFTQPAAHSNHVFTQPAAHSNHVVTQPAAHSNHVVTQPATHADHVHDTPFIDNDAQTLSTTSAVFGQGSNRTRAWTGSFSSASGSYPVARTSGNLTGGTSISHSGTAVDAHSAHSGTAVDAHSAHSGGAVDAHSAHSGGAVDAHSAHDSPASVPPYIALNFIIKA